MDEDEIEGKVEHAKGHAKEKIGRATDDAALEAEGAADGAEGEIREGYGEAKDRAKRAIDDLTE